MDFRTSNTRLTLLLREVRRQGPGPGEGLHAAPRFWAICAITGVLPEVGIAMRSVEHWHWGEADCVCIVTGGSEALREHSTVRALAIPRQAVSSAG